MISLFTVLPNSSENERSVKYDVLYPLGASAKIVSNLLSNASPLGLTYSPLESTSSFLNRNVKEMAVARGADPSYVTPPIERINRTVVPSVGLMMGSTLSVASMLDCVAYPAAFENAFSALFS